MFYYFIFAAVLQVCSALPISENCAPQIFPRYGPVYENTNFTFENFNCLNISFPINISTDIQMFDENHILLCARISNAIIVKLDGSYYQNLYNWMTPIFNQDDLNKNLSIKICNSSTYCETVDNVYFQPKPQPFINYSINVLSNKTIISGGIKQIFLGGNFDSVANPYMDIKAVISPDIIPTFLFFDIAKKDTPNPNLICNVEFNGQKLTCTVPRLNIYPKVKFDRPSDVAYMSLNFISENILVSNKEYFQLEVGPDPTILPWNPKTKDYPENERPHSFSISGQNLLSYIKDTDYQIDVGKIPVNANVQENVISFVPPKNEPNVSASNLNGATPVRITVGFLVTTIGYIQYNIDNTQMALIIGVAVGGFVFLLLVIIISVCLCKYLSSRRPSQLFLDNTSDNPYIPEMRYNPLPSAFEEKKLDFNKLSFIKELAQGNYGKVSLAMLENKTYVAVKTALTSNTEYVSPGDIKDTYREGELMRDIDHPNVMNLIAISLDDKNIPYLVIPFMSNGDLKSYLRKKTEEFTYEDLFTFALDALKGMEYLASKKIIHRDLAARNCMVSETRTVRISDFGLSKYSLDSDYYKATSNDALPVKWLAIECFSLENRKFSEKSDVWSFGVLMWEIITKGQPPYATVYASVIHEHLERGNRLENPGVEEEIYDTFMSRCWLVDPNDRPTFSQLRAAMERHLSVETTDYLRPVAAYLTPI